MKVQEVLLKNNRKRYILLDDNGKLVIPVVKFLKYLDNTEKSPNTLRTYCYALKSYFEFLKTKDENFLNVTLKLLAHYTGWLKNPFGDDKITPLHKIESKRSATTINLYLTAVVNFYDYLYSLEEISENVSDKLFKMSFGGRRKYKDFLYHINKSKPIKKSLLKLKVPKKKPTPLTNNEIKLIINSCSNIRDIFLIRLLFETGLRIGEVLSLFKEDIEVNRKKREYKISIKNRGDLINNARIKTGERRIFVSYDLIKLFDKYMGSLALDVNIDTNFLFIKIDGKNKGEPLEYQNISSLFRRLKKKTGINLYPHLFRHTHATRYYNATKNIKSLQERLGHAQLQTTANIYLHPSLEELSKEWKKAKVSFVTQEIIQNMNNLSD